MSWFFYRFVDISFNIESPFIPNKLFLLREIDDSPASFLIIKIISYSIVFFYLSLYRLEKASFTVAEMSILSGTTIKAYPFISNLCLKILSIVFYWYNLIVLTLSVMVRSHYIWVTYIFIYYHVWCNTLFTIVIQFI